MEIKEANFENVIERINELSKRQEKIIEILDSLTSEIESRFNCSIYARNYLYELRHPRNKFCPECCSEDIEESTASEELGEDYDPDCGRVFYKCKECECSWEYEEE